MKYHSRIVLMVFFVLGCMQVWGQNEKDPWAISLGVNVVDYYPTGTSHMPNPDVHSEAYFSELFNYKEHYNIAPYAFRLSVSRYIGSGFSLGLSGSINEITKLGDRELVDQELSYFSFALTAKYSFRSLIDPEGWFDPYLGVGPGYNWLDDISQFSINATLGFNFWFKDNFAITLQGTYKRADATPEDIDQGGIDQDHFQHSLGVTYVFGETDSDNDGVNDSEDNCPYKPGLAEFNGCPDNDGDGVQNQWDECPNKPGQAKFKGCPDTDGDGISDSIDQCLKVPGLAILNGCPDSDGDGISDRNDRCPNKAGPAGQDGCPNLVDDDKDGIPNQEDECPDLFGTKANKGCPKEN